MSGGHQSPEIFVALPVGTLRLLVGGVAVAILVMMAMLALEVVILLQVFDLIDVVEKLVPPGL